MRGQELAIELIIVISRLYGKRITEEDDKGGRTTLEITPRSHLGLFWGITLQCTSTRRAKKTVAKIEFILIILNLCIRVAGEILTPACEGIKILTVIR